MPRGGARPNTGGRRPGAGRKKGVPNKTTGQARAMFQAFVDNRSAEINELWGKLANGYTYKQGKETIHVPPNPAQALNVMGRLAEFILPKLNRTEVTGADGAALVPPNIGITFGSGGPGYGGPTNAPAETEDQESADGTADEGAAQP